jgi:hypothetical protein
LDGIAPPRSKAETLRKTFEQLVLWRQRCLQYEEIAKTLANRIAMSENNNIFSPLISPLLLSKDNNNDIQQRRTFPQNYASEESQLPSMNEFAGSIDVNSLPANLLLQGQFELENPLYYQQQLYINKINVNYQ